MEITIDFDEWTLLRECLNGQDPIRFAVLEGNLFVANNDDQVLVGKKERNIWRGTSGPTQAMMNRIFYVFQSRHDNKFQNSDIKDLELLDQLNKCIRIMRNRQGR